MESIPHFDSKDKLTGLYKTGIPEDTGIEKWLTILCEHLERMRNKDIEIEKIRSESRLREQNFENELKELYRKFDEVERTLKQKKD